jgi:uncharacterized membrane protein
VSGESPILAAVAGAAGAGDVRAHLSRARVERDALARAREVFLASGMDPQGRSALVYVNLRRRKFALVGGAGFEAIAGKMLWPLLARELRANLRATHPERAVAITVERLGAVLREQPE